MTPDAPETLRPDSPCIGYCSCSIGDYVCSGCGRTQPEVDGWLTMSGAEKRAVWTRLTGAYRRFVAIKEEKPYTVSIWLEEPILHGLFNGDTDEKKY